MPSERAELLKKTLARAKPFSRAAGIKACRAAQDRLGLLAAISKSDKLTFTDIDFSDFSACLIQKNVPSSDPRIILYLHGGGYTAGGLAYARGFGSILADEMELRVLCAAYRLAPENPYPAAVDDALASYNYLLESGYLPENILLCGESAGGGLIFALCLRLKLEGKPLPRALIALSPWTDLTCNGPTHLQNATCDPSLSTEQLVYYAGLYAPGRTNDPLVSPIYGDLSDLPQSLIFVGGDEILLSDATILAERLKAAGCTCDLIVEDGMWHVYVLYPIPEATFALARIRRFLGELRA